MSKKLDAALEDALEAVAQGTKIGLICGAVLIVGVVVFFLVVVF
jgi:hypothetical protein